MKLQSKPSISQQSNAPMRALPNTCRSGFSLMTYQQIVDLTQSATALPLHHDTCTNQKKTLVLDIDETLLSSTWWTNEIQIGDIISRRKSSGKPHSSSKWTLVGVFALVTDLKSQRYSVTFRDNFHMIKWMYSHWTVKVRGVLCRNSAGDQRTFTMNELHKDFHPQIQTFSELHAYNLRRPLRCPVSFFCEGFMVRLRPHLPDFLQYVCESFKVILFTAAERRLQERVVEYVQHSLQPILGDAIVFDQLLFREDCDRIEDGFRKNIAKLDVCASHVIVVDDKAESFRGFETNAIRIKPFLGNDSKDDQLLHLQKFLASVVDVDDVRYDICGFQRSAVDEECADGASEDVFMRHVKIWCEHALQN